MRPADCRRVVLVTPLPIQTVYVHGMMATMYIKGYAAVHEDARRSR